MLLEAPLSDALLRLPRLAESAAPAAICCFLDFAGMNKFRTKFREEQPGCYPASHFFVVNHRSGDNNWPDPKIN